VKIAKLILRLLACAYLLQVIVAIYLHVRPLARKEYQGDFYVIRKGVGLPDSLFPALGAIGFLPETWVSLDIYSPGGKKAHRGGFDVESDVYEAYPQVWPEHRRMR
jgi:hypothetical protein